MKTLKGKLIGNSKKISLLFILYVFMFFISCSNSDENNTLSPDNPITKDPVITVKDVYISGYEYNYSTSKYRAKYWKNGIETYLTDGTKNAKAFSVFVYGEDVYIAGYEENEGEVKIAKYWKNGISVNLTVYNNGDLSSIATSIYIENNIIYVTGYKGGNYNNFPSAEYTPVLWTNGVLDYLPDGYGHELSKGFPATPTSLVVKNGNVYIAGNAFYDDGIFWKNGVSEILEREHKPNFSFIVVNSLYLYNNDVYITGSEHWSDAPIGGGARFWKNGVVNPLPSLQPYYSKARSIYVTNNNVYIAGSDRSIDGLTKAVYWKNGIETFLPQNGIESSAKAVFVNGEDTYIVGYESKGQFEDYIVKYWKNGTEIDLSRGIPTSMFVK